MHEMSIVVELLAQLETVAAENDILHVEALTVQAGVLRGVVPEAFDIAFESASKGTIAEGSELTLEILPALARCRQCGCEFEPGIDSYLCPGCNQADVDVISGNEVMLASVTGPQEDQESQANEN